MTKLYFIFLLCALTSAQHAGTTHSIEDASGVYHAASTQSRSSSSSDGNEHSSYISHIGAVRSGTGTPSSYTHQVNIGSTRNVKDHNGLTQDEVLKLIAEGNRRHLHLYNTHPKRPRLPKRYNSLHSPIYNTNPLNLGKNDERADTNTAQVHGSSGLHQLSARSVENVGNGYEREASSEEAKQDQEAENARRFFLLNNRHNPPNAYNPLDPYAELNDKNYNAAFGQYKTLLN